jgi:hypothetical protein
VLSKLIKSLGERLTFWTANSLNIYFLTLTCSTSFFVFVCVFVIARMSKAKKVKNALTSMLSFRSTRSRTSSRASSSRANSEMEVDPPSPAVRGSSLRQQAEVYTLLRDSHIKF